MLPFSLGGTRDKKYFLYIFVSENYRSIPNLKLIYTSGVSAFSDYRSASILLIKLCFLVIKEAHSELDPDSDEDACVSSGIIEFPPCDKLPLRFRVGDQ